MLFCLFAQTIFAQINFSLQLDKFGVTYTVFATPAEDMTISENVLISTAQVTLNMYRYNNDSYYIFS